MEETHIPFSEVGCIATALYDAAQKYPGFERMPRGALHEEFGLRESTARAVEVILAQLRDAQPSIGRVMAEVGLKAEESQRLVGGLRSPPTERLWERERR